MNTEDRYNRFKDAPWFSQEGNEDVLIGGAGGIGSWLALFMERAGFRPTVYDFDIYEGHNMGGQFCKTTDIGKPKVEALRESIKLFTGGEIYIENKAVTPETMGHWYSFSGFDNMAARKVHFENWLKASEGHPEAIFIDGRLTLEQLQIYCVTPANAVKYLAEALFDDAEVEELSCTMKQTTHSAAMIASHIVGFFTNHYTNVKMGVEVRSVPFFWQYFIPIDQLTTEE